ncbi:MAG: hypothetical protein M1546_01995, partial [Chloroflexi bacterium]|nr:hypothetical protein [Chloroflexota bacterium]
IANIRNLRDSAFALTSIAMTVALFGVGFVHNRLLGAGMTLPQVFTISGVVPIVAGALLVVYSFVRSGKSELKPLAKTQAERSSAGR